MNIDFVERLAKVKALVAIGVTTALVVGSTIVVGGQQEGVNQRQFGDKRPSAILEFGDGRIGGMAMCGESLAVARHYSKDGIQRVAIEISSVPDMKNTRLVHEHECDGIRGELCFSTCGQWIVVTRLSNLKSGRIQDSVASVEVVEVKNGQVVASVDLPGSLVFRPCTSPTKPHVAIGVMTLTRDSIATKVLVLELPSLREIVTLGPLVLDEPRFGRVATDVNIRDIEYSPDGKRLAFVGDTIGGWNTDNWMQVSQLSDWKTHSLLLFGPAKGFLTSSQFPGQSISVWRSVDTWLDEPIGADKLSVGNKERVVELLKGSADGRLVFGGTNDGRVLIWDFDQRSLVRELQVSDGRIEDIAYSESLQSLFVLSDGTVRLYRCSDDVEVGSDSSNSHFDSFKSATEPSDSGQKESDPFRLAEYRKFESLVSQCQSLLDHQNFHAAYLLACDAEAYYIEMFQRVDTSDYARIRLVQSIGLRGQGQLLFAKECAEEAVEITRGFNRKNRALHPGYDRQEYVECVLNCLGQLEIAMCCFELGQLRQVQEALDNYRYNLRYIEGDRFRLDALRLRCALVRGDMRDAQYFANDIQDRLGMDLGKMANETRSRLRKLSFYDVLSALEAVDAAAQAKIYRGDYSEAEELVRVGVELLGIVRAKNRVEMWTSRQSSAILQLGARLDGKRGHWESAIQALELSERHLVQKLGTANIDTIVARTALGEAVGFFGDKERAANLLEAAAKEARQLSNRFLRFLADAEQIAFLERRYSQVTLQLLNCRTIAVKHERLKSVLAEALINSKGMAVDDVLPGKGYSTNSGGENGSLLEKELREIRSTASHGLLFGARIDRAELEKLLRRESAILRILGRELAEDESRVWLTVDAVRQCLRNDAIYVDFCLAYAPSEEFEPSRRELHYVAIVIPPVGKGDVVFVELGDKRIVDEAVGLVRSNGLAARASKIEFDSALSDLEAKVFQPLASYLSPFKYWVICPEGDLWTVPWCAFDAENGFVIKSHAVGLVTNARDMVNGELQRSAQARTGDCRMFLPFARTLYETKARKPNTQNTTERSGNLRFAAHEVTQIQKTMKDHGWRTTVFSDINATETSFFGSSDADVLVFCCHATNGLLDEKKEKGFGSFALRSLTGQSSFVDSTSSRLISMGRCALELRPDGVEWSEVSDGWLTGLEIMSAPENRWEMVVLSMCDAGSGNATVAEGASSIAMAFRKAGANCVACTLWPSSDLANSELVPRFLGHWIEGENPMHSLQLAQQAYLKNGSGDGNDPRYWANWVVIGRPW